MPVLLTSEQLCDFLSVSRTTLFRFRKNGLPFIRIGRSLRYRLDDIELWLSQNHILVDSSVFPEKESA